MAVAVGRTSVADRTQTLKVGDRAPDFELPGHRGGERFRLSDLRGKKNADGLRERSVAERAIVVVDKQGMVPHIDVHHIGEAPENAQILEVLRELD